MVIGSSPLSTSAEPQNTRKNVTNSLNSLSLLSGDAFLGQRESVVGDLGSHILCAGCGIASYVDTCQMSLGPLAEKKTLDYNGSEWWVVVVGTTAHTAARPPVSSTYCIIIRCRRGLSSSATAVKITLGI